MSEVAVGAGPPALAPARRLSRAVSPMSLIEVASERMLSPVHFDLPSDALADLASSGLLASAVDIFEWPHSAGGAHDFDTMGKHHQALHAPPPPPPPPPAPLPVAATRPYETSLKVFRRHLTTTTLPNGTVQVGAEGIISRACYEDWLSTRPRATSEPEKTFQRILTCCVSGTDGRQPFNPDEEDGVLKQLRLKRVWPAFADSDLSIGSKGFRSCAFRKTPCSATRRGGLTTARRYGFHEKARLRMSGEIAPESGASKPLKRAKRTGTSSLSGHESPAMAVAAPLAPQDAAPQAAPEPLLSADDAVNFSVSFDWLMTAFNSAVVGEGSDSLLPDDAAAVELTAADLGSALAAFEMRHPGWAAAAIDIARSNVAAVQNGVRVLRRGDALTDARCAGEREGVRPAGLRARPVERRARGAASARASPHCLLRAHCARR